MKLQRFGLVLLLFMITVLLQSCGNGGNTDTSGSLTLSSPTATDNKDGSFSVTTTATYSPPAGAVPNGVVINIVESVNGIIISNTNHTLTDSNAVVMTYLVYQSTQTSSVVTIDASIGGMSSQVSATIPALANISATPVNFLQTDAAGTSKTTSITGGVGGYSIVSVSAPADLNVSISGSTLTVTTLNVPGTTSKSATIKVQDLNGNQGVVPVSYF